MPTGEAPPQEEPEPARTTLEQRILVWTPLVFDATQTACALYVAFFH
ncbi:hypothetical protein G3I60_05120 [Streptomyces sp. SID13666]|nr:hypothetical protein [Streptomyces sp. SID13666]NEA53551.1 hypothetical protein [Streptomyces sp. SID13666]